MDSKQARRNRQNGAIWEKRVREDLENKGWFVSKYQNNIDIESRAVIAAKTATLLRRGTLGFPDFIAWKKISNMYEIIGVECKIPGYLVKEERIKCTITLERNAFSNIYIAKKTKIGRRVIPIYLDCNTRKEVKL